MKNTNINVVSTLKKGKEKELIIDFNIDVDFEKKIPISFEGEKIEKNFIKIKIHTTVSEDVQVNEEKLAHLIDYFKHRF